MIHEVLMTGLTPLSNTNEIHCWDNRPFTTIWPENQLNKSKGITKTIKKKPKRGRTAFTTNHLRALERAYSKNKYIDAECRRELANTLNISEKCIKVWFQNRRMKEKKEASESSCDSSSEAVSVEAPTPSTMYQPNQLPIQHNPSQFVYNDQYYQLSNYYQFYPIPGYETTVPDTVPDTEVVFQNDNNIHPTQYYPSNGLVNDVESNLYAQYNEPHNYWPVHFTGNNDSNYL